MKNRINRAKEEKKKNKNRFSQNMKKLPLKVIFKILIIIK